MYSLYCIPATHLPQHTQIHYFGPALWESPHVILVPRRGTRIIRTTPILVLFESIPLPFGCLRGNVRCCLVLLGHLRGAVNVAPSQQCPCLQHHCPRHNFVLPNNPGLHLPNNGGTTTQIAQTLCRHNKNLCQWEEYTNVHNALKKQVINAIEPIYLCAHFVIANIANIYVHECLQFLFDTYGHITPTDLSNNSVITSSYHGMQPHHLKC